MTLHSSNYVVCGWLKPILTLLREEVYLMLHLNDVLNSIGCFCIAIGSIIVFIATLINK
nr:MAG TPA: hypothetical protein [Caudoviricetes sp.]